MKSGFTLIELIVVIGIAILVTIGSVVGISASTSRRQAKTSAEKIKYIFQEVISMARNPDQDDLGLKKIEIVVYPYYNISNTGQKYNELHVYKCKDLVTSTCVNREEIEKFAFTTSTYLALMKDVGTPSDNLTLSSDANGNFRYFSICAVDNCTKAGVKSSIGQVTDTNTTTTSVYLPITDLEVSETYRIKVNFDGLVELIKV